MIDNDFDGCLESYDRVVAEIELLIVAYERQASELILNISKCSSLLDSECYFDRLYEIQGKLAALVFGRNYSIAPKLLGFVKEFDRLHEPYIRDYWHKRFKEGLLWPE